MSPHDVYHNDLRVPFADQKKPLASIGVIGLGYVGLPLSIQTASRGYRVVGFDIDEVKVAQLSRREASFLSRDEAERFKRSQSLSITSNELDIAALDAYILCVPTPVHENTMPDLRPLESACATIGRHLNRGALVIVESTVSPGVCEEVALPILEKTSGLSRSDFFFAHCPERINPGDPQWDVRVIPRVIGASSIEGRELAYAFYSDILESEVLRMDSIKEAEAVKMVENAFRDINIAFVNELAIAFDRAGIDLVNVIRGASTKPFGFMPFYPGTGVGGHCIPVDPYYLIRYGEQNGFKHHFLIAARRINSSMPSYTVSVLETMFKQKKRRFGGSTVALLGLAYKRGIPDTRESPARAIHELLIRRGISVRTYDPYVVSTAKHLDEALANADAAVIATDHDEICALTPRDLEKHGVDIVLDGRNCLDIKAFAASGVLYRGIGRGAKGI